MNLIDSSSSLEFQKIPRMLTLSKSIRAFRIFSLTKNSKNIKEQNLVRFFLNKSEFRISSFSFFFLKSTFQNEIYHTQQSVEIFPTFIILINDAKVFGKMFDVFLT